LSEMRLGKLEKVYVNSEWQAGQNIKIAERLFSEIDSSRVSRVLEVGCGIGVLASYLAKAYKWEVTGIDLDPEQIAKVRSEHTENGRLRFFEADVTKLPFEKDEFDMVLSFDVSSHLSVWSIGYESEFERVALSQT